jgi:hypothetical protein
MRRSFMRIAAAAGAVVATLAAFSPTANAASGTAGAPAQGRPVPTSATAPHTLGSGGQPYEFTNRLGLVLGVNGGQMLDGNKVVQWWPTGAPDQSWFADYVGGGGFRIRNFRTDGDGITYCLDVPDGNATVGLKVQIWRCNSNDQQIWFWDTGTGYAHLYNLKSGRVLAVNGGDAVIGRDVIQWSWVDSLDQYWGAQSA